MPSRIQRETSLTTRTRRQNSLQQLAQHLTLGLDEPLMELACRRGARPTIGQGPPRALASRKSAEDPHRGRRTRLIREIIALHPRAPGTSVPPTTPPRRRPPDRDALVWPAGLDRALVAALPLPESTHQRLRQAGLMEGNNALTAHEVLSVPCMSSRAIRELLIRGGRIPRRIRRDLQGETRARERRGSAATDAAATTDAERGVGRRAPGAEQTTKNARANRGGVWSVVRAHPADSNQNRTTNQDGVRA